MATVDFYFEGRNITIQCNKNDKMKQIFQRFLSKNSLSPNSVIFIYDGNNITNIESTFEKLLNIDDRNRNKMTILVSKENNYSSSQFIFEIEIGADKKMKEYAKMTILFAINESPEDDHKKCLLISEKFEEKYSGHWNCSVIKDGDAAFYYDDYYMKIKYGNYTIKIANKNC